MGAGQYSVGQRNSRLIRTGVIVSCFTNISMETTALESALRERLNALEVGRVETVRAFADDAPPAKLAFYTPPQAAIANTHQTLPRLSDLLRLGDAGLKAQSVDSGLPTIYGRSDVQYIKCSDEHGVIADPQGVLKVGERLKLVPGHCDPTANIHDWYVGVRKGKVEVVWPVSARGKAY